MTCLRSNDELTAGRMGNHQPCLPQDSFLMSPLIGFFHKGPETSRESLFETVTVLTWQFGGRTQLLS